MKKFWPLVLGAVFGLSGCAAMTPYGVYVGDGYYGQGYSDEEGYHHDHYHERRGDDRDEDRGDGGDDD